MNDFTKDELLFLYQLAQYQSAENSNEPLINKIQSMIDSYCEHGAYIYEKVKFCLECERPIE